MIELDNVTVSYPDGTLGLNALGFSVGEAERVAVVGANGAGKTTLLLTLVGVLSPSCGTVRVGGVTLDAKRPEMIRKSVGLVFQNPDDQLFMPRIFDDVAFGPRNMGLSEDEVQSRSLKALEEMGISELKERSPLGLSGGEKRRAAIATVLSMQPPVMLFDEPSSFLDPKARRQLIETLRGLKKTLLVATHDIDFAVKLCPRALVLKDGKLFVDGASADILTNQKLMEEAGL